MTPTVVGKTYLMVFCRSCRKGVRVIEEPIFEGKEIKVQTTNVLKCHRCGHQAQYQRGDMYFSTVMSKPPASQ